MPRAGRRRSVVWTCFVENTQSGKRRVLCRFCQHDVVANPIRMVSHIIKHCPSADEQHKKICREYQSLTVPSRRRSGGLEGVGGHLLTAASPAAQLALVPPHSPAYDSLSSPPLLCSPSRGPALALSRSSAVENEPRHRAVTDERYDEQENALGNMESSTSIDSAIVSRAHEELVLAVAATSESPFELICHPRFRKALRLLGIYSPTVEDVHSSIIPRIRERVEAEAKATIQAATALTIQVSAMSTVGTFLMEWFASDQCHRQVPLHAISPPREGAALESLILEEIARLPRKKLCPLYLCTDTFGTSGSLYYFEGLHPESSAPQLISKPVLVGRCLMQASLMLLANLLETIPSVRDAVMACVAVSEHGTVQDMLLKQSRGGMLSAEWAREEISLPPLLEAVRRVVHHQTELSVLSSEPLKQIVHDEHFWVDAKFASDILRPFTYMLVLSDIGNLSSSLILQCWLLVWATALHSSVPSEDEKASVRALVLHHIECYGDPLALICLVLDPRCQGLGLSGVGKRKVRTSVVEAALKVDPQVDHMRMLEQLVKYLNNEPPFDDEASWQLMASLPRLFWIEYTAEAKELASIALASLSFRPFIYSFVETWEIVVKMVGQPHRKSDGDSQGVTLKRLTARADRIDRQASGRCEDALEMAVGLFVGESAPSLVLDTSMLDEIPSYRDAIETDKQKSPVLDFIQAAKILRSSNVRESVSGVDASWFALDTISARDQIETGLRRALLGDCVDPRGSVVASTGARNSSNVQSVGAFAPEGVH